MLQKLRYQDHSGLEHERTVTSLAEDKTSSKCTILERGIVLTHLSLYFMNFEIVKFNEMLICVVDWTFMF